MDATSKVCASAGAATRMAIRIALSNSVLRRRFLHFIDYDDLDIAFLGIQLEAELRLQRAEERLGSFAIGNESAIGAAAGRGSRDSTADAHRQSATAAGAFVWIGRVGKDEIVFGGQ